MKKIILIILAIVWTNSSFAGDLQEGWNAFSVGDYETALREWTPHAERGDAYAQYHLGVIYQNGQGHMGIPKDVQKAMKWYRLAAAQNYASAQNNIGMMYETGIGVSASPRTAAEWYEKAAAQGFAMAQNNLGWLYYKGSGVPQDYKKASELMLFSAKQGYSFAQANLGWFYQKGHGVPKDIIKAYMFYDLSHKNGFSRGIKNRNLVAKSMNAQEIKEAKAKVEKWQIEHKKN